jgi:Phosphotransferase enzyme family
MIFSTVVRGDELQARLLLFLKNKVFLPIDTLTFVKEGVWIATGKETWLIKLFSSKKKLERQIEFTKRLYDLQFRETYTFHPLHQYQLLPFDGKYVGVMSYLGDKKQGGTYSSPCFRQQVLSLLKKFHETTFYLVPEFQSQLPFFHQLEKWKKRYTEFKMWLPLIQQWVPSDFLYLYQQWAEYALEYMEDHEDFFVQKPWSIIHGDVAHHNFLLTENHLYMIDFDLIAIAPNVIDYLQFCHRIIPNIQGNWDELHGHKGISSFLNQEPFKVALLYPTDIFREWNRFFKKDYTYQQRMFSSLIYMTIRSFPWRFQLNQHLLNMIK